MIEQFPVTKIVKRERIVGTDVPKNVSAFYFISQHYKFALSYVFDKLGFAAAILLEDDLDLSVDFFEYFEAGLKRMQEDESLWCISAFNDNRQYKHRNCTEQIFFRAWAGSRRGRFGPN